MNEQTDLQKHIKTDLQKHIKTDLQRDKKQIKGQKESYNDINIDGQKYTQIERHKDRQINRFWY